MSTVKYTDYRGNESSVTVKTAPSVKGTLSRAKAAIRKVATTVTIDSIDGVPLINLFPTASAYIDACTL